MHGRGQTRTTKNKCRKEGEKGAKAKEDCFRSEMMELNSSRIRPWRLPCILRS